MTAGRLTIAIVGLGPKGLYALDALCEAARDVPSQAFEVFLFESSPYPGAGPIYDPHQPDILLMNFPARLIDAWTDGRGPDFLTWVDSRGKAVTPEGYVPRAEVGRYLTWCFDRVVANAPSNIRWAIYPDRVTGLTPSADGWRVLPRGVVADEVLVTTGHQDWSRKGQSSDATHISSPFPVDQALTMACVPPGASVACKGFALTFIDTVLALTEGRGGVFTETEQGYTYQPSGDEPRLIAPFSRTGRPMRAKIEADRFIAPQDAAFWEARLSEVGRLLSGRPGATFCDDVWPALLNVADTILPSAPGTSQTVFADWHGTKFDADRSRAELRMGYDIALGTHPPDRCWALGEVWRRLYPRLVGWISHRELGETDATRFHTVAAEMERLAFGPPAQNVGKLICLVKAGVVSLDHLSGDLSADITIDATIPPAGSAALSPPLTGLLRDGHLSVGSLGGIVVNDQAQAQVKGVPTPGLSVIGRATEGSVLGNDTLSRRLHDLPERWADRVVRVAHAGQEMRLEQTA